jgi:hypothetical protein
VSTNIYTSRHRSGHAIISRKLSRYETQVYRRSQWTQRTITSSAKCRPSKQRWPISDHGFLRSKTIRQFATEPLLAPHELSGRAAGLRAERCTRLACRRSRLWLGGFHNFIEQPGCYVIDISVGRYVMRYQLVRPDAFDVINDALFSGPVLSATRIVSHSMNSPAREPGVLASVLPHTVDEAGGFKAAGWQCA